MQKSLFIALFMAITTCVFGQSQPDNITSLGNRRTETYYYKKTTYDSVRFVIQGKNDTVFMEELWRNGQSKVKDWVHDSLFSFNNQGLIESKNFYLKPHGQTDSVIDFYPNGQISSITAYEKNVFYRSKEFDEDGALLMQRADIFIGKYGRYSVQRDSLNRIFHTSFEDSVFTDSQVIIWHYDTLFYQNGQPYLVQSENKKKNLPIDEEEYNIKSDLIKCQFYNEKGDLIESMSPDSLHLVAFKDNVDCYYGLKNQKGDTIYKPRFDRIEKIDGNLMAVYEGSKCRLMHLDGRFLNTPDMESVDKISGHFTSLDNYDHWKQWWHRNRLIEFPNREDYFTFSNGQKYGVINRHGQIIVPPQYQEVQTSHHLNDSLFAFRVEAKNATGELKTIEEGYMNKNGVSLFPNYVKTKILESNRYFEVSNSLKSFEHDEPLNIYGLLNEKDELLLPCQFEDIVQLGDSDLFGVNINNGEEHIADMMRFKGIFDAKKRRWLVDTSRKLLIGNTFSDGAFVTLRDNKTKKYGLINAHGKIIFPFIYDSLSVVSEQQQLFIARKGKVYQFLNVLNKPKRPTYECLIEIPLEHNFNGRSGDIVVPVFLAKQHGKWGIVDSNDHILRPFIADYAACSGNNMLLVDHSIVHYFDRNSFPNEADLSSEFNSEDNKIISYSLADDAKKLFFFNQQGKIVIPPQYNLVTETFNPYSGFVTDYVLVENAEKKRKLVSTETGNVIDFPFQYNISIALKNSKLIVVRDPKRFKKFPLLSQSWGVVTTDGRQLASCNNSGIAIADAPIGTYFVRRDTPTTGFEPYYSDSKQFDTLGVADNDWFLYNLDGQLMDSTAFRFPIDFNNGLGIGMKGALFGLFRPDGATFTPPQYKNIRRDVHTGYYYLFENQGLRMTVSLKKQDGTAFIESGRYDGVSPFYGRYALTSLAGKIGLIDSFGKEIIKPQDLVTANTINLLDSISLSYTELFRQIESLKGEERTEKRD
jgi:hypothetical protein